MENSQPKSLQSHILNILPDAHYIYDLFYFRNQLVPYHISGKQKIWLLTQSGTILPYKY